MKYYAIGFCACFAMLVSQTYLNEDYIEFDRGSFIPDFSVYLDEHETLLGEGLTKDFDSYITLWSIRSKKITKNIRINKNISGLCVSKKKDIIALYTFDKKLQIYSTKNIEKIMEYNLNDIANKIKKIDFFGEDNGIICLSDSEPYLIFFKINLKTLERYLPMEIGKSLDSQKIANFEVFENKSKVIIIKKEGNMAEVYDIVKNNEFINKFYLNEKNMGFQNKYCLDKNGELIAFIKSVKKNNGDEIYDVEISINKIKDGGSRSVKIKEKGFGIGKIGLISDRGLIYTFGYDSKGLNSKLAFYRLRDGKLKKDYIFNSKKEPASGICISSDEKKMILFVDSGKIKIINLDEI